MLIKALTDYYDILAGAGKVVPEGFTLQKIHYLVALTPDGRISEIINYQNEEVINGKVKLIPNDELMPARTEKSAIESNYIEHRPLYLFGLNLVNHKLVCEDNKAKKSHRAVLDNELKNFS